MGSAQTRAAGIFALERRFAPYLGRGRLRFGTEKLVERWCGAECFLSGTKFGLFNIEARHGEVAIDRAQLEDVPRGYLANVRSRIAGEGIAIAVANTSNPMPRTPRAQSLQTPLYVNAMTGLLRGQGWNGSRARLAQHYRVDLNGDGNEEVLLCAQSSDKMGGISNAKRGDYSAVALRFYDAKREANKVQLVPLQIEIVQRDIEFGAPEGHEISSCVDANGDGAMEVVVRSQYYEGESITVFAFDRRGVRQSPQRRLGVSGVKTNKASCK